MNATLTDKEIFEAEKLEVQKDPMFLVEGGFLTIKTKKLGVIKLIPNTIQQRFIKKIKELLELKKPIRVLVLKARQLGLSTIIEAIIYAFTCNKRGINSCVVADDLDGANYIFEMQKLFQEYLDEHLKPEIAHSNEKKLSFSGINSQILIDTSDNPDVGRKYTFQFVHGTEVARWKKSLSEIMAGIGHAVPYAPETMIFLETTARGYEEFYDLWISAIDGKTDWVPVFFAWWEFPENVLPLENSQFYPIESIKFQTPYEKEKFLLEEKSLEAKYKLSGEQLNWRRWDIVNNCSGFLNKFNEDNPSCWQDAFVATGDIFFNRDALKEQEIKKPIAIGNIVKEESKYVFRNDPAGLFKLYEFPKQYEQYAIGADPAEGLENRDKSSGVVLNKKTNKTACIYNHNIPPDRFAEDLIKLGNYFNEALIACENKGYGYSVNQDLYKKYGKVYRKTKTKKGFNEPTMELGWNTNSISRPQMLSQLQEEIANGSTDLLDRDLINQCWTFVNNLKRGQPEAEKGKNDDLVMARAISSMVRLEHPFKDKEFKKVKVKRYRGLSGY